LSRISWVFWYPAMGFLVKWNVGIVVNDKIDFTDVFSAAMKHNIYQMVIFAFILSLFLYFHIQFTVSNNFFRCLFWLFFLQVQIDVQKLFIFRVIWNCKYISFSYSCQFVLHVIVSNNLRSIFQSNDISSWKKMINKVYNITELYLKATKSKIW
jgi:hypothetical protein